MHGFMKIHKAPKKVLTAVVDSLELMDPSRSTLGDDVTSSCSFITLEEAIQDLAALNWQDSYVTSLRTLNLSSNNSSSSSLELLHNIKVECVPNPIPIQKRKRIRKFRPSSGSLNLHNIKVEEGVSTHIPKCKRSRIRMLRLASLNGYNSSSPPTTTTTTTAENGFGSPSGSGGARNLLPRRKRIVRSDEFGSTVW